MSNTNISKIKAELIAIEQRIAQLIAEIGGESTTKTPDMNLKAREVGSQDMDGEFRVIEGVFDGQGMIGPDGKQYPVPANYASKSKLVEGDMLKLTIKPDGGFLFKQIGPVERERLVGVLAYDEQDKQYFGVANGQSFLLLTASVTYYKGEVGDEVILLVPDGTQSKWAAVENIVKQLAVVESAQKPMLEAHEHSEAELPMELPTTETDSIAHTESTPSTDGADDSGYDEQEDEFRL